MSDLHEVHFKWPSTDPSVVIVTGTFDEWSSSVHLVKTDTGFVGSVRIPWDTKIQFKYIVDSNWVCESTSPTQTDPCGNVNNVYISPPKPVEAEAAAGTESPESSAPLAADPPPEAKDSAPTLTGEAKAAPGGATFSQFASDLADTVVAADGTSSALGYVASALGAAIQSQIGIDPINSAQIAVETPKADAQFNIPEPPVAEASPVPAPEVSEVAPVVPIAIVSVNAGENNSAATPSVAAKSETTAADSAETPSTHTPLQATISSNASESVVPTAASVPAVVVEAPTPSEEPKEAEAPPLAPEVIVAAPVPSENKTVQEPEAATPTAEAPAPEVVEAATPSETKIIEEPRVAAPAAEAPAPVPEAIVEAAPSENKIVEAPAVLAAPPVESAPTTAPSVPVPEAAPVTAETVSAAPAVAEPPKPATNGAVPAAESVNPSSSETPPASMTAEAVPAAKPAASAPATPAKTAHAAFPSSDTDSPSPSRFSTVSDSTRNKRQSIFGKLKGAPATPTKTAHAFPSSETDSPSPSRSRFSSFTGSTREKRPSLFGKLKGIFHHDKEEKEKK